MTASLTIDPAVLSQFPEVAVWGFIASGVDRLRAVDDTALEEHWRAAGDAIGKEGVSIELLASHPAVAAWRNATTAQRLKPSTYKSSVESLVRRVLKEGSLRTPIPLVDIYCAVSARHLAPAGGYDLSLLPSRDLWLRHGRPGRDQFEPLGGRAADMPVTEQVVVYAAADTVICWSFNHRDSRTTALQSETTDAVFFSEAVTAEGSERAKRAMVDLADAVRSLGGSAGAVRGCSAEQPRMELSPPS
jgi:DNA/RNA-binding domain of Phe-tRNA-synthetase-like protein